MRSLWRVVLVSALVALLAHYGGVLSLWGVVALSALLGRWPRAGRRTRLH